MVLKMGCPHKGLHWAVEDPLNYQVVLSRLPAVSVVVPHWEGPVAPREARARVQT